MGKSAVAFLLTTLGPLRALGFVTNTVPNLLPQQKQKQQQHGIVSRDVHLSALEGARLEESLSPHNAADRRTFLLTTTAALVTASALPQPSHAASKGGKVVVFGGSGYIGSHVDQQLSTLGYKVVSVSRASSSDQSNRITKNLGTQPANLEYISLDASTDDLTAVLKDATAVISCIGALGSGKAVRATNGAVNARIATAAKSAGVKQFVYVSVASELANGPAKFLLKDYLGGKAEAETAVTNAFGAGGSLIVKPSIVDGAPPGEKRPPGPPGVKAAKVDDVAKAVVAGVTGRTGVIDGNAAIAAL
eukprot:CAMPEP_0194410284 /NCGR_PEP_ID=MMETSP0176-20130528/8323_1 /TAXON_ID=216777 /ORGANISM="Proboscia alata, Strain PI-D3" /LENGTH=304 /DNA_ID=CAMNT_0039211527 /DNA_START=41 /DNA_END=955 /DNA_ORIENTATION=-